MLETVPLRSEVKEGLLLSGGLGKVFVPDKSGTGEGRVGDCSGDIWRDGGLVCDEAGTSASVINGGSRGAVAIVRSRSSFLPTVAGDTSKGEGRTTLSQLS